MKTTIGVGIANSTNGFKTGQEVAKNALSQLRGAQPTLALLFASHPDPQRVVDGVFAVLDDVPLVGATSAGEYSHDGYVEDGAGLMLLRGDTIQFHPLSYAQSWLRLSKKLLGRLNGLSDEGLGSSYNHRALMLFPDDQSMNLDDVVERAISETGMLYDIIGGPSPTIPSPPRPSAIFSNQKIIHNGLVGAEILSQQPIGVALANGWTPVSGPYRITSVDKKRIVKIDGRTPRDIYEDFLQEQGIAYDTLTPDVLKRYPIGVCSGSDTGGDCKVSMIMKVDERGGIHMGSPPPRNALVHILSSRDDAMFVAARRAVQSALQTASTAAGVLFIDCMATSMVLEDAYAQQRQAVTQTVGENIPFLGFRSHGVLARMQGQTSGHYECSVGTWVVPA